MHARRVARWSGQARALARARSQSISLNMPSSRCHLPVNIAVIYQAMHKSNINQLAQMNHLAIKEFFSDILTPIVHQRVVVHDTVH